MDWDPSPNASQFLYSDHELPCNGWAASGLHMLAELARVGGTVRRSVQVAAVADALKSRMLDMMWDPTEHRFCDGICAENRTLSVYSDITALYLGLVPQSTSASVWEAIAAHGLESLGAYGAFLYLNALATYPVGIDDDGSTILSALTKCDATSWCAEWERWNATLTMEAFPSDVVYLTSYAHPWGTSAIQGIVHGLAGVRATSPRFATFDVKPRVGSLARLSLTVPSLHGPITVTVTPNRLEVNVPCGTRCNGCMYSHPDVHDSPHMFLDGVAVVAARDGAHLCTSQSIGCGRSGAARVLMLSTGLDDRSREGTADGNQEV